MERGWILSVAGRQGDSGNMPSKVPKSRRWGRVCDELENEDSFLRDTPPDQLIVYIVLHCEITHSTTYIYKLARQCCVTDIDRMHRLVAS